MQRRLLLHPPTLRPKIARDLLEWWDFRITRSLIGTAQREIGKEELLDKVFEITSSFADDNLSDNFGSLEPPSLDAEIGSNMERQITLVAGGPARVRRAALARWRARQQRARWLADRVGLRDLLDAFDQDLQDAWHDRHAPMCDDCATATAALKQRRGRGLLDWSHNSAHLEIPRLRPKWDRPFVVQGTYQDLAERLVLGWHPDFKALFRQKRMK